MTDGGVDVDDVEGDGAEGPETTGTDDDEPPVVLVVDDEKRVGEAFAIWLGDDYEVLTATSGETGLELLDETVDVVLLDRHMPGLSGDEVLERIREQGYDCRVALVTGVDSDFDIVDMAVDDYVTKPVDGAQLKEVVERLLRASTYDGRLRDLLSLSRKQVALEAEKSAAEFEESDAYQRLVDRRAANQRDLDEFVRNLSVEDTNALFQTLPDTEFEGTDADADADADAR